MEELFKRYKTLDNEKIQIAWSKALIVLDTNVLLNLFRYPIAVRDEYFKVLKIYEGQIWIPFIVALEFFEKLDSVLISQQTNYAQVISNINLFETKLEQSFKEFQQNIKKLNLENRHQSISYTSILNGFEKIIEKTRRKTKKYKSEYEGDSVSRLNEELKIKNSEFLNELKQFLEGKIGEPFETQKEIDELDKVAQSRYINLIPPGFKDSSKSKDPNKKVNIFNTLKYKRENGDFYLWIETIEKSKKLSNDTNTVVLITDDSKNDWWNIVKGRKTGPRRELIDEMITESNNQIENLLIYNSLKFLEFASEEKSLNIKESTYQIVKRLNSEMKNSAFNLFLEMRLPVLKLMEENGHIFKKFISHHQILATTHNREEITYDYRIPYKNKFDFDLNINKVFSSAQYKESHKYYLIIIDTNYDKFELTRGYYLAMQQKYTQELSVLFGYCTFDSTEDEYIILYNE